MSKYLIFAVLFVGFQCSCAGEQAGLVAEEGAGPRTVAEDRGFEGCWIGSGRGSLQITDEQIFEFTNDPAVEKHNYELVVRDGLPASKFVLKVASDPNIFCVEQFNLIAVESYDEIRIENFNSIEELESGRPYGHCSLVRVKCE